ncbi:rod shape-determining protein MreC [bacterium]|jgi:rod shape-determining protein MreC|nr:rod shape-determining protein MreC [bacterium]MBT3730079.1 rod shape-determining protein MreC [bacterium]MBT4894643.1 rod shape-determining protein MreC [bacterium]
MSNYLLHHKEKKEGLFTKAFVVVLLVVVIIVVIRILFPNTFTSSLQSVSSPFWKAKNSSVEGVVNSSQLLRSKRSLIFENDNLKTKIEETEFKLLEFNFLSQENDSLKELLGRKTFDKDDAVLGAVLARPNVSPYDTFIIDIGKNSGIQKGDSVFVQGDVFIGKISEVNKNTSTAVLFSSPGEITQVSIGLQNISANAKGRGGGNFIVELPRGTEVEKGDVVTMPGIDTKLFAVVEEIEANPSSPFTTILFKNPVNMNDIKWVQVVKTP